MPTVVIAAVRVFVVFASLVVAAVRVLVVSVFLVAAVIGLVMVVPSVVVSVSVELVAATSKAVASEGHGTEENEEGE